MRILNHSQPGTEHAHRQPEWRWFQKCGLLGNRCGDLTAKGQNKGLTAFPKERQLPSKFIFTEGLLCVRIRARHCSHVVSMNRCNKSVRLCWWTASVLNRKQTLVSIPHLPLSKCSRWLASCPVARHFFFKPQVNSSLNARAYLKAGCKNIIEHRAWHIGNASSVATVVSISTL